MRFGAESRRQSVRNKLTRRRFLQAATASAAGTALGCSRTQSPRKFFDELERRALEALCAQIVPADRDPGAREAGVVSFIERQLFGPYRRYREPYRQGLGALDRLSRALYGETFAALAPAQQEHTLVALDRGEYPEEIWEKRESKRFFDLVVRHTMQGFYGDPRHGGNRGGVSWKMLGVPYPPVRGRSRFDLERSPGLKTT